MQKATDGLVSYAQCIPDGLKQSNSNSGSGEISQKRFTIELLVILSLAALAYITLSSYWIKFSRAEVFFAECAREMLATRNFITPLYHAQPFFDKPIFVYWLIIGMFKTFGISHFSARIPSILASLVTLISIALAGAYLFGRRAGLLSALMLASSFMYLSFSCLCMSDMFLVMFDLLTLIAIYAGIVCERNRSLCWWLAAISMGFAFLTKGPVGIVLPALATLIYMALTRRLTYIKAKHVILALITIAVIASPWFYVAYLANGSQSMVHFFIQENLQRFAGSTYDVHKPFWYIVISFFLGFAPWSLLMPLALFWFGKYVIKSENKLIKSKDKINSDKKPSCDIKVSTDVTRVQPLKSGIMPSLFYVFPTLSKDLSAELFLWIWVFISVGFFCFSRGKCDYYTLPAFTGAALLSAYYISRSHAKYLSAAKALGVMVLVSTILFSVFVLPQINKLVPIGKYVTMIGKGPDDLRIGIEDTAASWIDEILFQSGKDPQRLAEASQIAEFMSKPEPSLLIMPEDKYNLLPVALRKNYCIISADIVATHPLTPGYLIEKAGNIADPVPFVVATNFSKNK